MLQIYDDACHIYIYIYIYIYLSLRFNYVSGVSRPQKKKDKQNHIYINGQKELSPKNINIPSDLSSASFFIVAALINKNSYIEMKNINLNPTRDGILKALNLMGAKLFIKNKRNINGEIVADIEAKSSELNGCELNKDMARLMIDEYPI